jgi:hypothetical protein
MNHAEAGELLARIQVHDNRQVGEVTIEEWQHDLASIDYGDALAAVREHRRASTEYLTANHVIQGVKRIREKRLEGFDADMVDYPGDPDDIPGYLAWRRRTVALVASGGQPPPADRAQLVTRPMPALGGVLKRPPSRD